MISKLSRTSGQGPANSTADDNPDNFPILCTPDQNRKSKTCSLKTSREQWGLIDTRRTERLEVWMRAWASPTGYMFASDAAGVLISENVNSFLAIHCLCKAYQTTLSGWTVRWKGRSLRKCSHSNRLLVYKAGYFSSGWGSFVWSLKSMSKCGAGSCLWSANLGALCRDPGKLTCDQEKESISSSVIKIPPESGIIRRSSFSDWSEDGSTKGYSITAGGTTRKLSEM